MNLGLSLMLAHAVGQIKWPDGIDKDNKVVLNALAIYVWRAAGGICMSDLSIDRIEVKPDGLYAYPSTEHVAEGAALPTYVFAAFPPNFYRALECQSEGRCPRCEQHSITTTAVCGNCSFTMLEVPPDGALYVKPETHDPDDLGAAL